MTDFIHEHPKAAQPSPPPASEPEKEEIVVGEGAGQKRVYGYIFILFIVAFFLLLWSFLMNQRSNEEVLSELRGNASTLQTTLDRNIALEQQVEALEAQVEALTEENAALKREKAELETSGERWEESTKQFSRLALLEYHLAQENYAVCCELVKELEPLKETLPDGGSYNSGTPDPRSRYNEIVEQLARLGYLAVGADGELSFTEPVG